MIEPRRPGEEAFQALARALTWLAFLAIAAVGAFIVGNLLI